MNKLTFIALVTAFSLIVDAATAIPPVRPENILCSENSAAFVGMVVEARSHDCRLSSKGEYCSSPGLIGATVKIEEVILPAPNGFSAGQMISIALQGRNDTPKTIGGKIFQMNISRNGMIGFPPTGNAITDAEANQVLVGQRYVFAVHKSGAYQPVLKEPYSGSIYEGEDQAWARREWPSAECLHLPGD